MENIYTYCTSEGEISISADEIGVTSLWLYEDAPKSGYNIKETEIIQNAIKELNEYFEGKRRGFTIPLSLGGTAFQKKVWKKLVEIPYGETRTYKDIAIAVDSPKAFRAVGMSNNKNKIPIIIPCHRVIGSNGSLVGYALGLDLKKKLIELEKNNKVVS